MAALIYDPEEEWLRTTDGTPNSASYAAARRVMESDWLIREEWKP